MEKRKVAIVLFYDDNKNILIQDRRAISKHGEEYGFFGGHIEKDETPEQALKREIKEELGIKIAGYRLFKHYHHILREMNREVDRFVFLAKMPDTKNLEVNEGKIAVMKFEDSFGLKMVPGDIEILKEIYKILEK
jgi:8-oxo-dGTP diphosphatase